MDKNEHNEPKSQPDVEVLKIRGTDGAQDNDIVLARQVLPTQLPILPIQNRPFFPKMTVPMFIDHPPLAKMLLEASSGSHHFVGLLLRREPEQGQPPTPENAPASKTLYHVGVAAEVLQTQALNTSDPHSPIHVLLGIVERFRLVQFLQDEPYALAHVEYLYETEATDHEEVKAYSIALVRSIKELIQLNPLHKEELNLFMSRSSITEPGRLADIAAALTTATGVELQDVLETLHIRDRLKKVLTLIKKEIDISRIQAKISKQIEEKLSTQQREFFLREQLKAIKKELGLEKEGKEAEAERFERRIAQLHLPDEARERIHEELDKLKLIEPSSPEFNVTRNYLDWLTVLPWGIHTKDNYDIHRAGRILNRDHYGLEDVKDRILEFLSVGILKGSIAGSILCFVGPPGVGKTSIGQSIAKAMGRNFYRFSVGGTRDEAEIKGHRRTYIGALPGKFIMAMKTCKSANPVIMLDEIDKIGASYQGDPASALLEVLDPAQNKDFLDHYLDVRFDLSNVFFICTANTLDTIPRPLLDRMEVIKLAGYILKEKLEIARRFLIPKQLEAHGLQRKQVVITAHALKDMIDGYAREPGVRSLENAIKKLMRKCVKKIVSGEARSYRIEKKDVEPLLGRRIFNDDELYKTPVAGVITGLAWTSMGGDTLHIEATHVDTGTPGLKQTGQLGSVMVESTEIAYTFVRSFVNDNEVAREFFKRHFVHLHVPAGATPKDGPSAGITMASALYSLVMNKPIKPGFAMTGELSLTGRVLPIGGLKEKTIAAKRAHITRLVFPAANRKDFDELPVHIRKGIKPFFVENFKEVVDICFKP